MNKIMLFAVCAAMLASCSNDEDFAPQNNLKGTPITVTAGVAELTTRAGYEGTTTLPENFYLTIYQKGMTKGYDDIKMTNNGSGTTYTPEDGSNLLWESNDRKVDRVEAYTTNMPSFSVQTNQSAIDGSGVLASDLLGAKYNDKYNDKCIEISGDNISIKFSHLLCKLDVTFTWGQEFKVETITGKTITSVKYEGFGKEVTLNCTDCTVTNGTNTDDITAYTTTADNGETYLSEAIFAPYVDENPKIVITVGTGEEERSFSIGVTAPEDGFVSGNRYTMNVTIGGTPVDGGSVKATVAGRWETGINGNMATK